MILAHRKAVKLLSISLRRARPKLTALLFALILAPASRVEALVFSRVPATAETLSNKHREALVLILKEYAKKSKFGPDNSTRYSVASASHGGLVVAYLQGSTWCGSGGCTLLILKPCASSYKVISRVLAVHAPIMELKKITDGLPEFGVWVQGGGIDVGYEAVLSANRKGKYPLSAAMAQIHTSIGLGTMLIDARDQGQTLGQ